MPPQTPLGSAPRPRILPSNNTNARPPAPQEGSCNMQRLNAWLSKLLQERGADLFRSKGILSIAGSDDRHVFQGGARAGGRGRRAQETEREGWGRGWRQRVRRRQGCRGRRTGAKRGGSAPIAPPADPCSVPRPRPPPGVHMMLQFTSSAEGVGHPWGPGERRPAAGPERAARHGGGRRQSKARAAPTVRPRPTTVPHNPPTHPETPPRPRPPPPARPALDEKRVNKVVFIGKNLNRQELTDGFKACLEAAAAAAKS
jgi:G3E family GTPase